MKNFKNNINKSVLVVDYDRTLVDNNKKLGKLTKENLIKYQETGGVLIIASGRPYSGLKEVCKNLDMEKYGGYVIGCNGAQVVDIKNDKVLHEDKIEKYFIKEILDSVESLDLSKGIYTDKHLIVDNYTSDLEDEAVSNGLKIMINKKEQYNFSSYKMVFSKTREETHGFYQDIVEKIGKEFNVVKSSPRYIELTKAGADKGLSLKNLLLNINREVDKTIVIGDSQNDLPLFDYCFLGVAMGNGTEEIKKRADLVIGSNEEDSIGEFLNKIIN